MLAGVGLGKTQLIGDIADRTFAVTQGVENQEPFGVGDGLTQASVQSVHLMQSCLTHIHLPVGTF